MKQIGSLFGFPVFVQSSYLVLVALYVVPRLGSASDVVDGLMSAAIVTVSILLHEIGHAVAFRRFGEPRPAIVLWGLGGLTFGRTPQNARQSILISLAGPALGLLVGVASLAALLLFAPIAGDVGRSILLQLVYVNLFWTFVNLLPVHPMDGGHAVRTFLVSRRGDRGLRTSLIISIVAGLILVGLAASRGSIFMSVLVGMMLMHNWSELRGTRGPMPPPVPPGGAGGPGYLP